MAEKIQYDIYTVEGGEDAAVNTLAEIAKEVGKDVKVLLKLNPNIKSATESIKNLTQVLTGVGSMTEYEDDFEVATLEVVPDTKGTNHKVLIYDPRTAQTTEVAIDGHPDWGATPYISLEHIADNKYGIEDKYGQPLEVETLQKLNPSIYTSVVMVSGKIVLEVFVPGSDNTVGIKEYGILTDTTRTCYVKWDWNHKVNDTSGVEVKWEWLSADDEANWETGTGTWHEDKSDITDIEVFEHQYNPDEKAVRVRVSIKPIDKTELSTSYKAETSTKYKWCTYAYFNDFREDFALITPSTPSVEIDNYKLIASYENLQVQNVNKPSITHIQFQIAKDVEGDLYSNLETTAELPLNALVSVDPITGETITTIDGRIRYVHEIEAGYNYRVRARGCKRINKDLIYYSSWSDFTSPTASKPIVPELVECKVLDNKTVRFKWSKINSATQYTLQYVLKDPVNYKNYASDEEYFNNTVDPNPTTHTVYKETAIEVENGKYITLTPNNIGDGTGGEYLARVNASNSSDSDWSTIQHFVMGKKPDAPTTWSSTTTVVIGEMLRLYWIHNSKDGSDETKALITYWIDGSTTRSYVNVVRTTDNTLSSIATSNKVQISDLLQRNPSYGANDILEPGTLINMPSNPSYVGSLYMFVVDPYENITSYFEINTGRMTEGNKINWYVQTAGAYTEDHIYQYGPVSIERTVDIYAPPKLTVNLLNYNKEVLTPRDTDGKIRLKSLPFYVQLSVGNTSNNHKPTGYYISVVARSSYNTVDEVGNDKSVVEGNKVFSRYYDVTDSTIIEEISAQDLTLENNEEYEVVCTVSMNSGLIGENKSKPFMVAWMVQGYEPNAEITIHKDKLMALIRPFSYAPNGSVLLSVYRREFDGTFTEIAADIDNTESTWVTDPHPALDYARYRITARDKSTSAVNYYDVPAFPVKEHAVVIQWNERWQSIDSYNSDMVIENIDQTYTVSMLRLPYNIDVSNAHSPDVSLVRYIGRKRPVSYYGTQLGESATWNVEIPKSDTETLYALRRLAIYMGNVYVREPSGSGYWASINVSFSQKHLGLTIPVTINITPVEGGM